MPDATVESIEIPTLIATKDKRIKDLEAEVSRLYDQSYEWFCVIDHLKCLIKAHDHRVMDEHLKDSQALIAAVACILDVNTGSRYIMSLPVSKLLALKYEIEDSVMDGSHV